MATTVNSATIIGTMACYPSGTLTWVAVDVDVDGGDTEIDAGAILGSAFGAANTGRIIQACDGGGANLVINGGGTGLTLNGNPAAGAGNIQFRSNADGAPVAAIAATANIFLQVLIRI
jgi:hypothetical protein